MARRGGRVVSEFLRLTMSSTFQGERKRHNGVHGIYRNNLTPVLFMTPMKPATVKLTFPDWTQTPSNFQQQAAGQTK